MTACRLWLVRVFLKIAWSVGGGADAVDGLPRLGDADLPPLLSKLEPGDFVLLGNNGGLTHVAVHVGQGEIIHAMATAKTMRGWWGSITDGVKRALGSSETHVGVVRESLGGFLARYERDTWVVCRWPGLTPEERDRGLARMQALVGQPYDYGFKQANEAWYCTELVDEFLRVAVGERAPRWVRKDVSVPLLLREQVIEPVALLAAPELTRVAANAAALHQYRAELVGAEIVAPGA